MQTLARSTPQPILKSLDTTRPVLLVSARVSIDEVDYPRLPDDAYIFREGNLEGEDHYWFGRDVHAWFVPPRLGSLRAVLRVLYSDAYSVGCVLTDLGRLRLVGELGFDALDGRTPVEDWNDYLAGRPETARLLADPHPPSVLTTMMAVALGLGFSRIIVLDGQNDHEHLRKVSQSAPAEDPFLAGLRSRSRVARSYELGALLRLREAFPAAELIDGGATAPLNQFLTRADQLPDGHHLLPEAKPDSEARERPLYRERHTPFGSRRCAYVTYFDDDGYFWGAVAMANSLAKVSDYPVLALVPSTYSLPDVPLLPPNMTIMQAPRIRNELFGRKGHQDRFEYTFSKLGVFALTFLDRGVYLDADTLVLRNVDDLFDGEGFAAAPDFGFVLNQRIFNSGVFGFTPSAELFRDMILQNGTLGSYDGGDQGFLNNYFPTIDWLDSTYNTLWRMLEANPGVVSFGSVRVLHYVGPKPWDPASLDLPEKLVSLWLEHLGKDYLGYYTLWRIAQQRRTRAEEQAALTPSPEPIPAVTSPEPVAHWQRALELARSGEFDEAERLVRAYLRKWPNSVRTARVYGYIQFRRRRYLAWAGNWARIVTLALKKAFGRR